MTRTGEIAGVVAMTALAGAILYLIAHIFDGALAQASVDGRVPIADAGLFTALLLSFREVLAVIKTFPANADRRDLTAALSNSAPAATPNPPVPPEQGA